MGLLALSRRAVTWPFWIVAITLSIGAWFLQYRLLSPTIQWMPWIVSIAILGLPHGAQDEQLIIRNGLSKTQARTYLLLIYLAAGVAVIYLWKVFPLVALISFLVLACFHFGEGDLAWSRDFGASSCTNSPAYGINLLLLRGALPILLPIIAHPKSFASVASLLPGVSLHFGAGLGWTVWIWIAIATAIALQATFLVSMAVKQTITIHIATEELLDTLLMVFLFVSLPPLISVGIYFLFSHSHRYIARRILTLHTEGQLPQNLSQYWKKLWRFHRRTLWVSAAMVVLLPCIWLVLQRTRWSWNDAGPALLIALNALTVPHAVLVWYSDSRQRRSVTSSLQCSTSPLV